MRVHQILDAMSSAERTDMKKQCGQPDGAEENAEAGEKALTQSSQIADAMELTAKLWSRTQQQWEADGVDYAIHNLPEKTYDEICKGSATKRKKKRKKTKGALQSLAYIHWKDSDVQQWRESLMSGETKPTEEQLAFIDAIINRCREEAKVFTGACKKDDIAKPMLACLLGIPGAGKSFCIKLLRSFFEEVLHWEDGVTGLHILKQSCSPDHLVQILFYTLSANKVWIIRGT